MDTKKSLSLMVLPTAIILFVIIGMLVGIGADINDTIEDSKGFTTWYKNDTVAATNNTYLALTQKYAVSIVSAGNASAAGGYELGNFTVLANKSASSVAFTGWPEFTAGQNIWVYYSYNAETYTANALRNSTQGLNEVSSNSQLLGLILIMGAVITILLGSFGTFMRGSGGL